VTCFLLIAPRDPGEKRGGRERTANPFFPCVLAEVRGLEGEKKGKKKEKGGGGKRKKKPPYYSQYTHRPQLKREEGEEGGKGEKSALLSFLLHPSTLRLLRKKKEKRYTTYYYLNRDVRIKRKGEEGKGGPPPPPSKLFFHFISVGGGGGEKEVPPCWISRCLREKGGGEENPPLTFLQPPWPSIDLPAAGRGGGKKWRARDLSNPTKSQNPEIGKGKKNPPFIYHSFFLFHRRLRKGRKGGGRGERKKKGPVPERKEILCFFTLFCFEKSSVPSCRPLPTREKKKKRVPSLQ